MKRWRLEKRKDCFFFPVERCVFDVIKVWYRESLLLWIFGIMKVYGIVKISLNKAKQNKQRSIREKKNKNKKKVSTKQQKSKMEKKELVSGKFQCCLFCVFYLFCFVFLIWPIVFSTQLIFFLFSFSFFSLKKSRIPSNTNFHRKSKEKITACLGK